MTDADANTPSGHDTPATKLFLMTVITTDEPISDPDFQTIQMTQDMTIGTQDSDVTQDPSDTSDLDITAGIDNTTRPDDASGPAFVPGLSTPTATATTLGLDVTTATGTSQSSEIRESPVATPGSNNTLNTNATQGQNSTPIEDATLAADNLPRENVTSKNSYSIEDTSPSEHLSTKHLTPYVDTTSSGDTTLAKVNISGEDITKDEVTTFDVITFPGEGDTSEKETTFDMNSGTNTTRKGKTASGEGTTPVIGTSPREDITFVESTIPSEVTLTNESTNGEATTLSDGTYKGTGMSEYGTPTIVAEETGSVTPIAENPTARDTTPDEVTILDKGITNTESTISGENISVNEDITIKYTSSGDTTSSISMPTDEYNTYIENITVVENFPFGENTTFGKDTSKIITDEVTTFGLVISVEQHTTLLEEDTTAAIDIHGEYTSNKSMMPNEFTSPYEDTSQVDVTTGRITPGQNTSSEDATLGADTFPSENVTGDNNYPTGATTTAEHTSTKMLTPFEDKSRDTTLAKANTFGEEITKDQVTNNYGVAFSSDGNTFEKDTTFDDIDSGVDTSRKETGPSEDTTLAMNISSKVNISSTESTTAEVTIAPSEHLSTKHLTPYVDTTSNGDTTLANVNISGEEVTQDEVTTFDVVTFPGEGNTSEKGTTFDMNSGTDTTRKRKSASGEGTTPVIGTSPREDITFVESTIPNEVTLATQNTSHGEVTALSDGTYNGTGMSEYGTPIIVAETTGSDTTPDEVTGLDKGITNTESENISVNENITIKYTSSGDTTSSISMPTDEDNTYIENITVVESFPFGENTTFGKDTSKIITEENTTFGLVISVEQNTTLLEEDTTAAIDIHGEYTSNKSIKPYEDSTGEFTSPFEDTSQVDVTTPGRITNPGQNSSSEDATLGANTFPSENVTGDNYPTEATTTTGHTSTIMLTSFEDTASSRDTQDQVTNSYGITFSSDGNTFEKDTTFNDINSGADTSRKETDPSEDTTPIMNISSKVNISSIESTTPAVTIADQYATTVIETTGRVTVTVEGPAQNTTHEDTSLNNGITYGDEMTSPDETTTLGHVTDASASNTPLNRDINSGADTTHKEKTASSEITTPVMGSSLREDTTFVASTTPDETTIASQEASRSEGTTFSGDTYSSTGLTEHRTTSFIKTTSRVTRDPSPAQNTTPDEDSTFNKGMTYSTILYNTSTDRTCSEGMTPDVDNVYVEHPTTVGYIGLGEKTTFD
ncbi:mucin-12-like [Penaeus indicus]|uniref:mucin-12-like n=1 Tax=Penaeus indicus TaxID=29960 RepID=UPI00300D12D3